MKMLPLAFPDRHLQVVNLMQRRRVPLLSLLQMVYVKHRRRVAILSTPPKLLQSPADEDVDVNEDACFGVSLLSPQAANLMHRRRVPLLSPSRKSHAQESRSPIYCPSSQTALAACGCR